MLVIKLCTSARLLMFSAALACAVMAGCGGGGGAEPGEGGADTAPEVASGFDITAPDVPDRTDAGGDADAAGAADDAQPADLEEPGETVSVALTIDCPDCNNSDPVRFYAIFGEEYGMPAFYSVFFEPTFPVSTLLNEASDLFGVPCDWPAPGTVLTFQAFQDTIDGGPEPQEGEAISALFTTTLVAGVNEVDLTLDQVFTP